LINSKDNYTRLLQQITITAKRVNSSKAVKGLIIHIPAVSTTPQKIHITIDAELFAVYAPA